LCFHVESNPGLRTRLFRIACQLKLCSCSLVAADWLFCTDKISIVLFVDTFVVRHFARLFSGAQLLCLLFVEDDENYSRVYRLLRLVS